MKLKEALNERLMKAKYTKRTGSPGNYKYQYGTGGAKKIKKTEKTKKRRYRAPLMRYMDFGLTSKEAEKVKSQGISPAQVEAALLDMQEQGREGTASDILAFYGNKREVVNGAVTPLSEAKNLLDKYVIPLEKEMGEASTVRELKKLSSLKESQMDKKAIKKMISALEMATMEEDPKISKKATKVISDLKAKIETTDIKTAGLSDVENTVNIDLMYDRMTDELIDAGYEIDDLDPKETEDLYKEIYGYSPIEKGKFK